MTGLELPAAEVEAYQPASPTDLTDAARRQQYPLAGPPPADVDNDEANEPAVIVHQQLLDMSDHAVEQMNPMPDDGLDTAQMGSWRHGKAGCDSGGCSPAGGLPSIWRTVRSTGSSRHLGSGRPSAETGSRTSPDGNQ